MKLTFFLFAGLFSVLFFGCDKPICSETKGIETSAFGISIFNTATNGYMYPRDEFLSIYKKDSLQVYTDGGRGFNGLVFYLEQDPRNSLNSYYAIRVSPIFFIPEDNIAFTQETTKKIYLKYNYNTSDTLTLIFKAYKDNCDKGQYEYLKIYHKGNLISSLSQSHSVSFKVNH